MLPLAPSAWGAGAGGALAAAAARVAARAGARAPPLGGAALSSSLLLLRRAHNTHAQGEAPAAAAAAAAAAEGASGSPADPVITRVRQHLKDFAKLPWEVEMPPDRAASVLGAFFGLPSLKPGDAARLAPFLDRASLTSLLRATTPWPLGDAPTPGPHDDPESQRLNRQRVGRPTLGTRSADLEAALFSYADDLTTRTFGDAVYHRGIVEFSNVCANDCGYCGVRKHAPPDPATGLPLHRYTMPREEVAEVAHWAHGHGIGTLMLQSGELRNEKRLTYLESVVRAVRADTVRMDAESQGLSPAQLEAMGESGRQRLGLRVALSVGELERTEYDRLFAAGARRYLLRIETSNPRLYALLHPPDMRWERRLASLRSARAAGFQLGTGVMVGLPGQRLGDLAGDVMFFREVGANMIGIGPYITEAGTPVSDLWEDVYGLGGLAYREGAEEAARRAEEGGWCGAGGDAARAARRPRRGGGETDEAPAALSSSSSSSSSLNPPHADANDAAARQDHKKRHMRAMFELTTRVNALARLANPGANVTATTALQAVDPNGREVALRRGANVLMPILTPTKYRQHYQLYEGKPCVTDTADECRRCLTARVGMIGRRLRLGEHGDPPNFEEQESAGGAAGGGGRARARAGRAAAAAAAGGAGAGGGAGGSARSFSTSSSALSSLSSSRMVPGRGGGSSSRLFATAAAAVAAAAAPAARRPLLGSECASCGAAASPSSSSPSPSPSSSSSPLKPPPGPLAGSDVQRLNVGVFGAMNAGKSTLMNAVTRQDTSIVDATPGTTADVRATLLELHGVGPAKLLDTAGLDEAGALGEKKRAKALAALKECDVAVVVVDVARLREVATATTESLALDRARKAGAVPLLLLNLRGAGAAASPSRPDLSHPLFRAAAAVRGCLDPSGQALALALDLHGTTGGSGARVARDVADAVSAAIKEAAARSAARPGVKALPEWVLAAAATEAENEEAAAAAAAAAAARLAPSSPPSPSSSPSPLLQPALKPGYVFMVIPMDAETPSARLLRPQALVQEEAVRHWALTTAFRLDLAAARGAKGEAARSAERARFLRALRPALEHEGPKLLVTDSQAIDVMHPWTLEEDGGAFGAAAAAAAAPAGSGGGGGGRRGVPAAALGGGGGGDSGRPNATADHPSQPPPPRPLLPITTFSIAMINRVSGGRLPLFVDGLRAFAALKPGDRVLVAEACNHSRITAACADIGLVQIPRRLRERAGGEVEVEHAFGREFPDLVGGGGGGEEEEKEGGGSEGKPRGSRFALAAHCGGCMIDAQKMRARLSDAEEAGLPVTNYGLLLAFAAAPGALERCLAPWGVSALVV